MGLYGTGHMVKYWSNLAVLKLWVLCLEYMEEESILSTSIPSLSCLVVLYCTIYCLCNVFLIDENNFWLFYVLLKLWWAIVYALNECLWSLSWIRLKQQNLGYGHDCTSGSSSRQSGFHCEYAIFCRFEQDMGVPFVLHWQLEWSDGHNFRHSTRSIVESHCNFNLHFYDDKCFLATFISYLLFKHLQDIVLKMLAFSHGVIWQ